MTEDKSPTIDETARKEKALLGYEMAINLWIFQGAQSWARFNIMLLINSTLLGIMGLIMTSDDIQPAFVLVAAILAFVGIVFCIIWLFLTKRETEYAHYYVSSARELEERYLSDTVKIISRGRLFREGGKVTIKTDGAPTHMSRFARCIRARDAAYIVITTVVILHIVMIIVIITRGCEGALFSW